MEPMLTGLYRQRNLSTTPNPLLCEGENFKTVFPVGLKSSNLSREQLQRVCHRILRPVLKYLLLSCRDITVEHDGNP